MYESIKVLKTKTSTLFDLLFANNTILSCFFFFFLIIDLYLLIPAAIGQMFNPTKELVISIGIPTKEVKPGIGTHPVIVEIKFRAFYSLIHFGLSL